MDTTPRARAFGAAALLSVFALLTTWLAQVHTPDDESAYARRATDKQAVVWLWGGAHKLGDTEPDAATDTPLVLLHDMTAPPPERQRYWAIRFPIPGHPTEGPYPIPGAFEPVPELTPEQAKHVADFVATAPPAA